MTYDTWYTALYRDAIRCGKHNEMLSLPKSILYDAWVADIEASVEAFLEFCTNPFNKSGNVA